MIIEIIFIKDEILHDIQSDVTRIERMRKLEDTPILTSDDADRYMINRNIDIAVSLVISRMQAYIVQPNQFSQRIVNNHTNDWEEKSVMLDFPHNWPPHCVDPLKNAVHRFVCKTTLHNILRVALPQDKYVQLSLEESTEADNEINALINSRLGGVHIHPTPFG